MFGFTSTSPGDESMRSIRLRPVRSEPGGLRSLRCAWALAALLSLACAAPPKVEPPPPPRVEAPVIDVEIYRRAAQKRADRLAREVERLKADLRQAEEALVMAESGLRGSHSRADAVSRLAEVRIQIDRAAKAAPWRAQAIEEANLKIEDASRQVQAGNFGAALFFVYRAERIASNLESEADQVYGSASTRFVRGQRVNLRAGPSTMASIIDVLTSGTPVFPESRERGWVLVRTADGRLGWIHGSLLANQVGSVPGSAVTTQSRPADLAR
jgi:hypothetical protein